MQPDEIVANPAIIRRHAAGVDALATDVARARQAGDTVRMDNEAYGKLCTIVPMLVNSLQDIVLDAIGTADASLRDTADRLRTVADSYTASDLASEAASNQVGGS